MSGPESAVQTDRLSAVVNRWWLFVFVGAAWTMFGLAVQQIPGRSLFIVGVCVVILLLGAGANEFALLRFVRTWGPAHFGLGVLFLFGGSVTLSWPDPPYVFVAAILSWYLLAHGLEDVVLALIDRPVFDLWSIGLAVGFLQVIVGFAVAAQPNGSNDLLFVAVGLAALLRGMGEINFAFHLKHAHDSMSAELRALGAK
jgi:uncharacterized membrane protein HdeD (DUF308 family)